MGMRTAGFGGRALCVLSAVGGLALGTMVFVPSAYASVMVPRAPTRVVATPGNGSAVVKWNAPVNDGGSAITGYVVRSSPGSKRCKTTGAKTCIIRGLRNGTKYTIGVKAHNKAGLGAASVHVTVKPGVPLAPNNVGATAGNAQATVTWKAPATNGSAIRNYAVKSIPGSETCTNHTTTCTMTGTHERYVLQVRGHRHQRQGDRRCIGTLGHGHSAGAARPHHHRLQREPDLRWAPPDHQRHLLGLRRREHRGRPHHPAHLHLGHHHLVAGAR